MKVKVKTPASIGELIQGKIKGKEMLVSCPINIYSIVEAEVCKGSASDLRNEKVYKAVEFFLKDYKIKSYELSDIKISINSHIPRGKGMASSTADISGTLYALSKLLSVPLKEEEIAAIAVKVEPTDSTIFSNLTLLDHLQGSFMERIAPVLPIEFLLLEGKDTIDTLKFRKETNHIKLTCDLDKHYERLKEAIIYKDISLLGKICTESAFLNQKILYKPYLEELLNIVMDCGGAGLNIAHSGSVCGVIIRKETDRVKLVKRINEALREYFSKIYFVHSVKGGSIHWDI